MQRKDYDVRLKNMIDDGIRQGIYSPTVDATLSDLKKFQDFLRRNFKGKYDRYEDMRPRSNQFGKIYATAKTQINTPLWVFFTFFKLYKWYQIAQRTTYHNSKSRVLSNNFSNRDLRL